MSSLQIVFLFDLSACSDFVLKPKEELNKKLLSVRLACVRLLTEFSSKTNNIKWGFKFFDSSGSITQMMNKFVFSGVSLEGFETLENEICVRYERHIALLQALETSQLKASSPSDICTEESVNSCPVKILQFALTQILCEFQWESIDIWSPVTKKSKDKSLLVGKKNFVFLFSDFKDSDEVLLNYFGLNCLPSKHKFINALLPQDLRESLLQKANIHLVFLNTCQDQTFLSSSSGVLTLLSESLHSVQGSMIPLFLLSQPLYNMQFVNSSNSALHGSQIPAVSDLYSSFHNSLIPFSSVFQQSLHHIFYSKENSASYKCSMNGSNDDVKILLQVMTIHNKIVKNILPSKKITWSKFVICSAISKDIHYTTDEMLLCLPDDSNSDESDLVRLNKTLCLKDVNLLLQCITDSGINMPGLFVPLSSEAAVIFVLQSTMEHFLNSNFKNSTPDSLGVQITGLEKDSCQIESFKVSPKIVEYAEPVEYSSRKPFHMECMETWFKPTPVSSLESYIQSRSSNKVSKVKSFYKMLQLSVQNSKKLSSKLVEKNLVTGQVENSQVETQNVEVELSDLSYEELLSTIKNIYDSALEQSDNVFTSSQKIVKLVKNYYKKNNTTCLEDEFQNLLKNNLVMTARRISEKYEKLDSADDTKKKVKECQIQVLLALEIENCKMCSDKGNCVSTVSSLLRLMVFYSGITELQNFMHDVLLKNYSDHLYDVLVEIGDELSISIFDDTESTNSPTDTASSELINEEENFSPVISSNISEKSSSSTCSRKDKDNNGMERKLLRRRSDISVTASSRQVLLPKSAKKKKRKTAASKSVRHSPRIASKRKEQHTRAQSEKPRTVRRNLFPGSGLTPKGNKSNQPTTPRRKKAESHISKSKYVAETPSHKQSHSALQRRKSFMDKLSDSPKVIAESPQIMKSVKEGANKVLLEKLQRARLNTLKPPATANEPSSCRTFTQYTPESKRRLSLKLFSKLLASPTARMGIKKCTKRLFDQVSPKKDGDCSNKRPKSDKESEQVSSSSIK